MLLENVHNYRSIIFQKNLPKMHGFYKKYSFLSPIWVDKKNRAFLWENISVSAKTLQHHSAMECTRENPTLHLHSQKLFGCWHLQCSAGFFCTAIWLPSKQLVINPLLFSHTLISHKWKGSATWFISLCCTAKYSALPPPHQPLHHLLLAVSKDQLKLYFLYRLEERCSAVKQQWIFNKLSLFASAGYLSLYLFLHITLGPHFPVFHKKASTRGTLTLQP